MSKKESEKKWAEEVNNNLEKYLYRWLCDYKVGNLEKRDLENVLEKVLSYRRVKALKKRILNRLLSDYVSARKVNK